MKRIIRILTSVILLLCILLSTVSCGSAEEIARLEEAIQEYDDEIKGMKNKIHIYENKQDEIQEIKSKLFTSNFLTKDEVAKRGELDSVYLEYADMIDELEQDISEAQKNKAKLQKELDALK